MTATIRESDGNTARVLRLSITGECNLNCFYCRSLGATRDLVRTRSPINASDVTKLVKIMGERGINKVVIGGGEPLLRKDAANFVKAAYGHKNISEVNLVTNGTFLKTFADPLRKMGLKRVDVHFDSLNFVKYQKITGRDNLYRVLDGVEKVESLNYPEIRLNILLLNGINEDEVVEFARMTKDRRLYIRFQEYHPRVMSANPYGQRLGLSVLGVKRAIENYQSLTRVHDLEQDIPVPTFRFSDGEGKMSFMGQSDILAESAVPRVVFSADGVLFNELVPNRPQAVLADLRRDAKETKLHRLIEKIMSLHIQDPKKDSKESKDSKSFRSTTASSGSGKTTPLARSKARPRAAASARR